MRIFTKEERVTLRLMGFGPQCSECGHWKPAQAALLGDCDKLGRLTFDQCGCEYMKFQWKKEDGELEGSSAQTDGS